MDPTGSNPIGELERVHLGARQTHQNASCVTIAGTMTTGTVRFGGLKRLKIRTF
jgi:hypothetical protein